MKTHPSIQSPQSPCHQEALHREDLRPPSVPQRRSAPHKLWFVDGLRQRPRCRRKAGPHQGVSRTGRRARQRIWLESPHPSPPLQTRPVPLPSLRVPELLPALRATSQYPHTLVTRRVGFSSSASSAKSGGGTLFHAHRTSANQRHRISAWRFSLAPCQMRDRSIFPHRNPQIRTRWDQPCPLPRSPTIHSHHITCSRYLRTSCRRRLPLRKVL